MLKIQKRVNGIFFLFHNTACDDGWYGPSCQNQCGPCFGTDVCFHTNGSCPGNCSDGFNGDKCLDSKLYMLFNRFGKLYIIFLYNIIEFIFVGTSGLLIFTSSM